VQANSLSLVKDTRDVIPDGSFHVVFRRHGCGMPALIKKHGAGNGGAAVQAVPGHGWQAEHPKRRIDTVRTGRPAPGRTSPVVRAALAVPRMTEALNPAPF